MSLHLIESRKLAPAAVRERDGVVVSVVVHAFLILSTFSLAAAHSAPVEMRELENITYVEPPRPAVPPVHVAQAPVSAAAALPANAVEVIVPPLTAPIVIPSTIPTINIDVDMSVPVTLSVRHSGATSAPVGVGGGGNGYGLPVSGVLSDLQVDRPVAVLSGYRTPRYPEAARAAGIEQTLNVEFVVDTLGRIEPGSLVFEEGAPEGFRQAVRDALANAKFRPAEAGGRHVRQRVMQAFVFSLGKL